MASNSEPLGPDFPKRRWKDILWAVQPPSPDVAGWMDWATGILFLNSQVESAEHLERILNGERTNDVRELLSTITHENVHFLQMVTTGYMYRWVCRLYGLLVTAMNPLKQELTGYIDNPDPRMLLKLEQQIRDADRLALRDHLARVDHPGPNGITVRDLLEAHALLVEKKSHWQNLNAAGYLQMLNDEAPAQEYRAAYDLARFRLNDEAAFAWFPLVASLCLGAEDPPSAFDAVVDEMARWDLPGQISEESRRQTVGKVIAAVPDMIASVEGDKTPLHPLYTPAVLAIQKRCDQGFKMPEFYADPVNKMELILTDIVRPMVFRANAKDQFAIWVPPAFDQKMIPAFLIYSVLSSRVLGADLSETHARARVPGYEWMARLEPGVTSIESGPIELESGYSGQFDPLNPDNVPDELRGKLCALWGRCLISFGVDGDEPLWTRPQIRRFIASVYRSNPAFPVYFCMLPAFGMFQLWLGSLADPAAFPNHGTALDLDLGHASVIGLLTESIGAIEDMAEKLNIPARPLIQSLLTPYPRDAAVQICSRFR